MVWFIERFVVLFVLSGFVNFAVADDGDGNHGSVSSNGNRVLITGDEDDDTPNEDYFLSAGSRDDGIIPPATGISFTNANNEVERFDAPPPSPEEKLYRYLFGRGYLKNVRPAMDPTKPVVVRVGMCVMMVEDLIERDQMMIMAACVKMIWDDPRLVWNPDKFDNLTWLAVSNQQVWFPDIVIVNSPDPAALTRKLTNVGLSNRGEIGYFPSGRLFTRCNLVITYFPFDWQHCEVRFESWIYPTQYMELDLYPGEDKVDVKEHYANYQWTIKGYRIQSELVIYDGQNFSSITITFVFRRKSMYFSLYFIFPELLLATLQTLSHTLPVEHPGRMTMLTALFIGTTVTHSGVAAHTPKSSDTISLLQIYMTVMSVNLALSLIITFLMLYTVLRYPNVEPSLKEMLYAFFSVVWPKPKSDAKMPEVGNLAMRHYFKQFAYFPGFPLTPQLLAAGRQTAEATRIANNSQGVAETSQLLGETSRQAGPHASSSLAPSAPRPGAALGIRSMTTQLNTPNSVATVLTASNSNHNIASSGAPKPLQQQTQRHALGQNGSQTNNNSNRPGVSSGGESSIDENVESSDFISEVNEQTMRRRRVDSSASKSFFADIKPILPAVEPPRNKEERKTAQMLEAEAQELKRRWLIYCVALDKVIMYVAALFNILVPVVLFCIVPVFNEMFFMSQGDYQAYQA